MLLAFWLDVGFTDIILPVEGFITNSALFPIKRWLLRPILSILTDFISIGFHKASKISIGLTSR